MSLEREQLAICSEMLAVSNERIRSLCSFRRHSRVHSRVSFHIKCNIWSDIYDLSLNGVCFVLKRCRCFYTRCIVWLFFHDHCLYGVQCVLEHCGIFYTKCSVRSYVHELCSYGINMCGGIVDISTQSAVSC